MHLVHQSVIAFLCLCLLSACGPVVAVPSAADEDAPKAVSLDKTSYTLWPDDVIKLTVYGEEVLTGEYKVDSYGMITVPLIDKVETTGLTKEQLQNRIAGLLKEGGYLTRPKVTVDIIQVRPVYVLGEVRNPGFYDWHSSMDVLKVIAMAGGYTPRAARNMILLDRGAGQHRKQMNAVEDTPVLPGDVVTVRERIF